MNARARYLLSPWFTGALFLLICNDLWWKAAYSNALTGKLSDFSGVLVLGLLFNFFSERNRNLNALFVIVFFTFWKSPLSEGLIVTWNSLGLFPIDRVVDYSDLWAFIVLPIVSHLPFPERRFRPVSLTFLLGCSAFAFASTSRARPISEWQYAEYRQVLSFRIQRTPEQLLTLIQKDLELSPHHVDSVLFEGRRLPVIFLEFNGKPYETLIDSAEIIIIQHNPKTLQVHVINAWVHPEKSVLEVNRLRDSDYKYGVRKVRLWEASVRD